MHSIDYQNESDNSWRRRAIKTAKQLCYPDYVIEKLKNAKNIYEASNILTSARRKGEGRCYIIDR